MKTLLFFLLLVFFPLITLASGDNAEPSTREEFEQFWEKYIEAVKGVDETAVLTFVEFPFTSRGAMDFDPEITYTPETFKRSLAQLLQSDVGITELPTPMLEFLQQKQNFDDEEILSGEMRIGNFKFHKTRGTWKWYYAYYSASNLY